MTVQGFSSEHVGGLAFAFVGLHPTVAPSTPSLVSTGEGGIFVPVRLSIPSRNHICSKVHPLLFPFFHLAAAVFSELLFSGLLVSFVAPICLGL